ncbi:GntR family transcriptional regulator [Stackebrandtia nassauensis]|uniref:Transcriptional regulator, GntR family n=1 Tax=Stackebrandtia nassauensis (strain DSM 44728 / CIP 108903 / NRRL B-16338 / NBRC 102104 / LLR-40K-21) TaxID=446470 RepID=D3Q2W5_STANL|nr:GntR family transcriptional regulator [Stackebrandtia nassauensis]ADD45866.1 transcriptional regulator, GntR family [Stackebrandtia nassauensis DSM 44728]
MSSSRRLHDGKKFLIAAAALRRDIEGGKYAVSSKLPRAEELAPTYDVSKSTMERALQVLKDEGWLISYVGDGTYVQEWAELKPDELDVSVSEFYEQTMSKMGAVYEILDRVEQRLTALEKKHVNEPSPQLDQDEPQGQ